MSDETPPTEQELFFRQIAGRLAEKLPDELKQFQSAVKSDRAALRIRFRQLPHTHYELRLASMVPSGNHPGDLEPTIAYFGDGPADLLGVYYKARPKALLHWLAVILPLARELTRTMRKPVLAGPWGKRGVFAGLDLRGWELNDDPNRYAIVLARFIQATFTPASQAIIITKRAGKPKNSQ